MPLSREARWDTEAPCGDWASVADHCSHLDHPAPAHDAAPVPPARQPTTEVTGGIRSEACRPPPIGPAHRGPPPDEHPDLGPGATRSPLAVTTSSGRRGADNGGRDPRTSVTLRLSRFGRLGP
jgi:hypothetical protein